MVQLKDLAGQIQAAANQDARGSRMAGNFSQGIPDAWTGAGYSIGRGDDRLQRQGGVLVGLADGPYRGRERQQRAKEFSRILGLFHADD